MRRSPKRFKSSTRGASSRKASTGRELIASRVRLAGASAHAPSRGPPRRQPKRASPCAAPSVSARPACAGTPKDASRCVTSSRRVASPPKRWATPVISIQNPSAAVDMPVRTIAAGPARQLQKGDAIAFGLGGARNESGMRGARIAERGAGLNPERGSQRR